MQIWVIFFGNVVEIIFAMCTCGGSWVKILKTCCLKLRTFKMRFDNTKTYTGNSTTAMSSSFISWVGEWKRKVTVRHCRKENKMLKQLWDYIFLVRQALPAMIITIKKYRKLWQWQWRRWQHWWRKTNDNDCGGNQYVKLHIKLHISFWVGLRGISISW